MQLTEIITATAGHQAAIMMVLQTGDASWRVDFEDVSVELELDEASGRLVLTGELGVPPQSRRLTVFEALLSYALLWRDTGFVRVGLGGEDGALALMADTGADGLQPTTLAAILENFAEKIRVWRGFTVSENAAEPAPAAESYNEIRIWA